MGGTLNNSVERDFHSIGISTKQAESLNDTQLMSKKKKACNYYMKKPINISNMLHTYRKTLYSKYPEPKAKTAEEKEAEAAAATGAKGGKGKKEEPKKGGTAN